MDRVRIRSNDEVTFIEIHNSRVTIAAAQWDARASQSGLLNAS
jgi:hypothetical protein